VAVSIICADTDERARWLAGPSRLSFVRLRAGRPGRLPTPEEAAAHDYSSAERHIIEGRATGQIVGSPQTVRDGLARLLDDTRADELMITAIMHDLDDRIRSYDLVADIAAGDPVPPAAPVLSAPTGRDPDN
jgi:alkanesulfonate monooxygenase SsuD/methylene tetrahydromethanopterin reductase-like flavin-dependent oxidoreductase (luciferase family)